MFRRKEEENETETTTVSTPSSAAPAAAPVAAPASIAPSTLTAAPVAAPRPAAAPIAAPVSAPVAASAYRPATPVPSPASRPAASSNVSEEKKRRVLTVGNDILLKGEIATCDRLVIEGAVDAKLNDVHTVEIAQTGSFKGSAEIEDAEISGLFEGDLTVRNRLIIYSTGKVRGKITYGEIEIERGGELTGEIKTVKSAAESPAKDSKSKAA